MSVKPLTVTEIKGLRPRDKDYAVYDGLGLLLHVATTGGKVWRFRYSHPVTKKRQTYTIGRFPEFTLSEAREKKDELRRMLARNIDPANDKKNQKEEARKKRLQTFKSISASWFVFKCKAELRVRTLKNVEYELNKYLIPLFGERNILDITAPIAISSFEKLSEKSALQKKLGNASN